MLNYMHSYYERVPLSSDELKFQLKQWINVQVSRCTDEAFALMFPWKETGLPTEYFLQRQLKINGQSYLTGPRYKACNIDQPFIDIVAFDAPITSDVLMAVSKEWADMCPKYIRILVPEDCPLQGITDQLIYAFPVSVGSKFPKDPGIHLDTASIADLDWCQNTFSEAYQSAWETIPALREHLLSVDEEVLINQISDGSVHIISEGSSRAGIIICEKQMEAFLHSFLITGEAILPTFQGRFLASKAQRALCQTLSPYSTNDSLLMGTIVPENLPSIRAAERAGRKCVLRYEFLTV